MTPAIIFVFGSNEAGIHGAGAARFAHQHYGAEWGVGFGLAGQSFAIPTKDAEIETLPLTAVGSYVRKFLAFAREHSHMNFLVTRIGCGLAGYTDAQVAPLFRDAPPNCFLSAEFARAIGEQPAGG